MKITIYRDIKSVNTPFYKEVNYALQRIKEGKSKDLIEQIRKEENPEEQNKLKQQLPSVCFSGEFLQRTDKGLKEHSGLVSIDLDKFDSLEELKRVREKLEKDPYIYSVWLSPRANGLKGLVKIPVCSPTEHKLYFKALDSYFSKISDKFDSSTCNVSRVTYESYDPTLYLNEDSETWEIKQEEPSKEYTDTSKKLALTSESKKIRVLRKWFEDNFTMSNGDRNNTLFKYAEALNRNGVSRGEALDECLGYESNGFGYEEIKALVYNCYRNYASQHNTQFIEDKDSNYQLEKLQREGKSVKEISRKLDRDEEEVEEALLAINETENTVEFWAYDDKGRIKISPHKFRDFLSERGFGKILTDGVSTFCKVVSSVIETVTPINIKDEVLDYLEDNVDKFGYKPFDFVADNLKMFEEKYLTLLPEIRVQMKKDTKTSTYIYYRDCVVEVTPESINVLDYLEIDGYVWKDQILQRDFKLKEYKDESDIELFIDGISGMGDEERKESFESVIGYLLNSYNDRSKNRAIILEDENISTGANGGSGKSLLAQAVSHMKRVAVIDGKRFDSNSTFAYQTVGLDTQVLNIDDIANGFRFENLFSVVTEGLTIERKNQNAIKIPAEDSPKILISTNHNLRGEGNSHSRRKFEISVSEYYNSNNTPEDHLGRLLFADWDKEEWNKFDNFMLRCAQKFLNTGLIAYKSKNQAKQRLIKATSAEFYEWVFEEKALDYKARLYGRDVCKDFVEFYQGMNLKWLDTRLMNRWIEALAKYLEVEYDTGNSNGKYYQFKMSQDTVEEKLKKAREEHNNRLDLPF
jgi:hypothetical protein